MHCPRCGAENFEGVRSCVSCGQMLFSGAAPVAAAGMTGQAVKTSGLAIAAMVLAILSPVTCFITAIPAVVLGIIAIVQIQKSEGAFKGTGMAVTGIALPVLLLPAFALIMGILMPAMAKTRQLAYRMVCGTNMNGIGKAMRMYTNDYDGKFPDPNSWCDLLVKYENVTPEMFVCKGGGPGRCHYAMNPNAAKLGDNAPADMVLLFETDAGWNQSGGPEILTTEHHQNEGCNVLFVDGHVEFVRRSGLKDLRW